MERLTMQKGICQMASTDYCLSKRDCYECGHGRKVFKSLADYENTGLTPDEVTQTQKENAELKDLLLIAISANREYGECECCKYEAKDDTPCEEADYNCMYCGEECACRDCQEGSNWQWQYADRAREVGVEV